MTEVVMNNTDLKKEKDELEKQLETLEEKLKKIAKEPNAKVQSKRSFRSFNELSKHLESTKDLRNLKAQIEKLQERLDEIEDEEKELAEEDADQLSNQYFDQDDREIQEFVGRFLTTASQSKDLEEYITQVQKFRTDFVRAFRLQLYETYKAINEIYDAIDYNPGVGGYCFGDYCDGIELDVEKQLEKAFFEYFFKLFQNFKISQDDFQYCANSNWFKYCFSIDFNGTKYEENHWYEYDEEQIENEEAIESSNDEHQKSSRKTELDFNSQKFIDFKDDLCIALNLDLAEFDKFLNMNLVILELKLNEDEDKDLRCLLQTSESAKNRLKEISDAGLIDIFDFAQLMQYLSKNEKKNLLNI